MTKNFVEELRWRGMLQDIMPGTEEQLMKEMTTAYVGIDPTADSLHIGHLCGIMMLRHLQACYEERLAFATSDEGKDYLFPLGLTLDGKRYETKASGGAVKAFHEESRAIERTHSPEEAGNIFRTAFLLFIGQVDAATSFAQNCGGGGSAPDQNWGRDKNEDDILWARRCFRKAREMVTTPVIRRGMKR